MLDTDSAFFLNLNLCRFAFDIGLAMFAPNLGLL